MADSVSVCGNGRAETGEQCDGRDLRGLDCNLLGFLSGRLLCSSACLLDLSHCGMCGNGILEPEFGEECDGTDLGGASCSVLTGGDGTVVCTDAARLDLNGCQVPGTCGNGVLDTGEQCDGTHLGEKTCETLAPDVWGGGFLRCTRWCTFDTSECELVSHCGNGRAETAFGEQCNGSDLAGLTCEALGFFGGTLACGPDCTLDTGGCETGPTCGDGLAQGQEECDGTDLRGRSCEDLGYPSGHLRCLGSCRYDTTGCRTCGNGVADPGEECDGLDLGGASCESLGYAGGMLGCRTSICRFDTILCVSECGNGVVEPDEGCDDGDFEAGDGCVDCQVEPGWVCGGQPSICSRCPDQVCQSPPEDDLNCPEDCAPDV